ncbi:MULTISPECIES: VOC family protein [unclassified Mycobacterium]|uniref:VOC family protein n=1 Tax=unclassified Mycobacterium TaxID=2642494 RepID=UPI0029C936B4|nr:MULTISPECIES: VOC family protein [unclassified Mycobacterium]
MSPIGIERVNYIALNAKDPEAAAKFAAERLGFTLEHASPDGTHYLSAHGVDRYSLVYKPGDSHGLHHVSYLVGDGAVLEAAETRLTTAGVDVSRHEDGEWEANPAIRFSTPGGHLIEFTTGVHTDIPVSHLVEAPKSGGAVPVVPDHVGIGTPDFDTEDKFLGDVLGQLHSSRIFAGGEQIMTFLRSPGRFLYHDVVLVRTPVTALHHIQFSLKTVDQFYQTATALEASGVQIEWGPLRHGPGHNIAMYFRDAEGYWFEYSVEEEIILYDPTYVPRSWSVDDPHAVDEWDTGAPPAELMGGPPPTDALLGTDLDETFSATPANQS